MSTYTTAPALRVWIGCLACYNAGTLTGDWVDAIDATEFVPCTREDHEEFWVMDYDGQGLTEECSPAKAQQVGDVLAQVEPAHLGAFAAYCEDLHETPSDDMVTQFQDAYLGEWENTKAYAFESLAEEFDTYPETAQRYFDRDATPEAAADLLKPWTVRFHTDELAPTYNGLI